MRADILAGPLHISQTIMTAYVETGWNYDSF